ncbi:hypothetical protein AB4Z40_31965 [Bosea sp. 2YAB26]|uniref:hypothetical protein n=1 Tax=Bosea sp. 2YAB26 TaxID=3237478 RepID=UPI003F8F8CF2
MTMPSPEPVATSPAYWTHNVKDFPSPVAQFRMAQLVDLDGRLYETARVVYRFMVGWYMDERGDALLSQRYVVEVMKQRAPDGAVVPSRNAVQRAITALMDTGWVVRTHEGRGKGKGASRYVPVANVLELAAQKNFPQLAHANGPVDSSNELAHANGPPLAHANGPVQPQLAHANGPKTTITDPRTDAGTSNSNEVAAEPAAGGLGATASTAGFEKIWIAYGRLGNKAAARAEFAKLVDPDVDHIVERAASWAASARPGQKRMPLEKWLAAEKFDEADRQVVPKELKAKDEPAATIAEPDNDNAPEATDGYPWRWPIGEFAGEFTEGRVEEWAGEMRVTLSFRVDSSGDHHGKVLEHGFFLKAVTGSYQEEGQATLNGIRRALGLQNVDDTDQLLGRPLVAVADGTSVAYRAVSELEAA